VLQCATNPENDEERFMRGDITQGELGATLSDAMQKILDETLQFRSSCGFLLVAIDDLAHIDTSRGSHVADQTASAVGERIRRLMRGKDILGRFSIDTFGLVLRECTPNDLTVATDRIQNGVRDEPIPTSAGPVAVTVTIGGITAPRYARTVAEIFARAKNNLDSIGRAAAV
jgi:diguanylate cyclase (GGDEF)-like protein